MALKTQATIDKLYFIQIRKFCVSNQTIEKMKGIQRMGENFANHIYDESLVSKIYKELLQLNSKKTTQFKSGQSIWIDISPKNLQK